MKTETGHPETRSRGMNPRFNIRITMKERAGGGPSPAQIKALREKLNREYPCFMNEKH